LHAARYTNDKITHTSATASTKHGRLPALGPASPVSRSRNPVLEPYEVKEKGAVPDHVPELAVSVWPSSAVPETAAGVAFG
jgi:hypothetical protein